MCLNSPNISGTDCCCRVQIVCVFPWVFLAYMQISEPILYHNEVSIYTSFGYVPYKA